MATWHGYGYKHIDDVHDIPPALPSRRLYPVELHRNGMCKVDAAGIAEVHEGDEDVGRFVGHVRFVDILALPPFLFEIGELAGFTAQFEAEELRRTCDEALFLIGVEGLLYGGYGGSNRGLQHVLEIVGRHDRTSR